MTIAQLLLAFLAIFAAAKLFGELAERFGQPAVLGEMIGGIVILVTETMADRERTEVEIVDAKRS